MCVCVRERVCVSEFVLLAYCDVAYHQVLLVCVCLCVCACACVCVCVCVCMCVCVCV